jgi:Flp pilus assembly protein TadG
MILRHEPCRRGATIVEGAITLTVLITLIFGMMDLGLGVMRFNMISHAAREGVRQAMVHGGSSLSQWSPGTWTASNAGTPVVDAVSPHLVGCDLKNTTITITWVDGSNAVEQRVQVTINTTYQPLMTYIFGATPLNLQAASTSRFAH